MKTFLFLAAASALLAADIATLRITDELPDVVYDQPIPQEIPQKIEPQRNANYQPSPSAVCQCGCGESGCQCGKARQTTNAVASNSICETKSTVASVAVAEAAEVKREIAKAVARSNERPSAHVVEVPKYPVRPESEFRKVIDLQGKYRLWSKKELIDRFAREIGGWDAAKLERMNLPEISSLYADWHDGKIVEAARYYRSTAVAAGPLNRSPQSPNYQPNPATVAGVSCVNGNCWRVQRRH